MNTIYKIDVWPEYINGWRDLITPWLNGETQATIYPDLDKDPNENYEYMPYSVKIYEYL